jgi:hypothetical protein
VKGSEWFGYYLNARASGLIRTFQKALAHLNYRNNKQMSISLAVWDALAGIPR